MRQTIPPALVEILARADGARGPFSLRPVGALPEDNAAWVDRDLASMFEGFRGEQLTLPLTEAERDRLSQHLPPGWEVPPISPEDSFGTRLWIVEHQTIVGTILLAPPFPNMPLLQIFALYVDPGARGRGAAEAALDMAQHIALEAGHRGIQLDALWAWGKAVRFYLDRGFWLRLWKRGLHLARGTWWPRREVKIAGDHAELAVLLDEGWETMLRAERQGARLLWSPTEAWERWSRRDVHLAITAEATFALILANRGWPLATSEDTWTSDRSIGDLGGPDALGLRIERFEAMCRLDGMRIDAPRIPGCLYRSADELGLITS